MNHLIKEDQIMDSAKSAEVINMQPRVAILLCTYNGQEFLQEQLDSFISQTHSNWVLYVSDDGSTDNTLQIIENFEKRVGEERVILFKGPRKGFAANFLSLIHHDEIKADYFSFSDQDDVWLPEKLEAALNWLKQQPKNIPTLYCSRTILIDAKGKIFGQSDVFLRPPSFANALVQSIGGGNTMVLNRAARNLVSAHSPDDGIVSHDWWVYILISGNEGAIKYDPTGYVLYRQHGGNLVGMNGTWMARVRRAILLFQGRFREWNDCNIRLICSNPDFLTKYSQPTILDFCSIRESNSLFKRLTCLRRSKMYRQTFLGNLGLIVAVCLNKI
jgi:glycosyltransferase involved in cell wall biosynthesis